MYLRKYDQILEVKAIYFLENARYIQFNDRLLVTFLMHLLLKHFN